MNTNAPEGNPSLPLRILLVDDHEDTNRLLLLLLKRRGYEARAATSIASAVEAASQGDWDVLVCDMGLPDGSGLELLGRMPRPPLLGGIVVSGHSSDEDFARSKAAGYAEHLVKPVSVDKLEEVIKRMVGLVGRAF